MNVISLRDYAKKNGVSYEAVRKQVVRYKTELGHHIIVDGRQQFLDEEAVTFLDAKRQKSPVIIMQQDKDEQIRELQEQNKILLTKYAAQGERIEKLLREQLESKDQRLALEEAVKEKKLLEGFIQDAKAEIKVLSEEKAVEAAEASRARQEASEALLRAEQAEKDKEAAIKQAEIAEKELEAYKKLPAWKRIFIR